MNFGENEEYDFAFKHMYDLKQQIDYFILSKTYGVIIFYDRERMNDFLLKATTRVIGILLCRKRNKIFNPLRKYIHVKVPSISVVGNFKIFFFSSNFINYLLLPFFFLK